MIAEHNSYEQQLEERYGPADSINDWHWPIIDKGAFGAEDGPLYDWVTSHKELYLKYCKKFDVVVQAGGNCGMYPRLFSDMFRMVYTFEPDPLNFYALTRNCQKDNIVKIQAAVGFTHELVSVAPSTDKTNIGMHRVVKDETSGWVPTLRIDDLALKQCDLIQLDTEGCEYNAILGAVETISRFRPVLALENSLGDKESFLREQMRYRLVERSRLDVIYIPEEHV